MEIEKRKADPEAAIRQMIDLNPDIPEPWNALEEILIAEGRLEEAEDAKKRAKKARKRRDK